MATQSRLWRIRSRVTLRVSLNVAFRVAAIAFILFFARQVVAGDDVTLPSDEIWLCDLDSGTW